MDKTMVLDRLAEDKPLFHHLDDDGARRVALAGITAPPGDTSWAVGAVVLRWIADHVSGEMVTAETGAGKTRFCSLRLPNITTAAQSRRGKRTESVLTWNELGSQTINLPSWLERRTKRYPGLGVDTHRLCLYRRVPRLPISGTRLALHRQASQCRRHNRDG